MNTSKLVPVSNKKLVPVSNKKLIPTNELIDLIEEVVDETSRYKIVKVTEIRARPTARAPYYKRYKK